LEKAGKTPEQIIADQCASEQRAGKEKREHNKDENIPGDEVNQEKASGK
jgi:hypothetical protein